jgi:hypothetical protein
MGFLMTVTVVAVPGSSRSATGCDEVVVAQAVSKTTLVVMTTVVIRANVATVGAGILLSFTIGLVFGRLQGCSILPYRTQSVMQGQTPEADRGSRVCGRRRCDG